MDKKRQSQRVSISVGFLRSFHGRRPCVAFEGSGASMTKGGSFEYQTSLFYVTWAEVKKLSPGLLRFGFKMLEGTLQPLQYLRRDLK